MIIYEVQVSAAIRPGLLVSGGGHDAARKWKEKSDGAYADVEAVVSPWYETVVPTLISAYSKA